MSITSEQRKVLNEIRFLFDHEEFRMKFYDQFSNVLYVPGYEEKYIIDARTFYVLVKRGYITKRKEVKMFVYQCRE